MLAPFLLAVSLVCVSCYKPVVLVHGLFGSAPSEFGDTFESWIKSVGIVRQFDVTLVILGVLVKNKQFQLIIFRSD